MTDPYERCPYCGAERRGTSRTDGEDGVWFACGTFIHGYRGSLCSTNEALIAAWAREVEPRPWWRRLLAWFRGGGNKEQS